MDAGERNEKIEEYGRGYDLAGDGRWPTSRARPGTTSHLRDDWSVHEIIVHMGDSESMAALRLRKLIVEPGSTLMGYDEAKWADALDYQKQDADDSLQIIKLARQTTYRLLKTLPADGVQRTSVKHPEYSEPYTFDRWLTSMHATSRITWSR